MEVSPDTVLIATSPGFIGNFQPKRFAVGLIAGTIAHTLTSPLSVVKLFMQVSNQSFSETVKNVYLKDGIAGFWSGNATSCLRLGPHAAIKFFAYEELQRIMNNGAPLNGWQRAFSGAVAGALGQTITYPLDVIATRLTLYPNKYRGIFRTTMKIVQEEGVTALFAGLVPTLIGVIPYSGSQFFAYETLKIHYNNTFGKKYPMSPVTNCLIGATAGMFSQLISYPLTVVRKRMMIYDENGRAHKTNMPEMILKIYSNEGITGLYRGLNITLLRAVPFAALQFTLVEEVRKALNIVTNRN